MRSLFAFLFVLAFAGMAWAADITYRENIKADADYKADGVTFEKCNLYCPSPHTFIPGLKNCTFVSSNLFGCEVDESNRFEKSNVIDTSPTEPEATTEELKARVEQLETFITSKSLAVPKAEATK